MIKTFDNLNWERENYFVVLKMTLSSSKNKLCNVPITDNQIIGFAKLVAVVAITVTLVHVIKFSIYIR